MKLSQKLAKIAASALAFAIIFALIGGVAAIIDFFGGYDIKRAGEPADVALDPSITAIEADLTKGNLLIESGSDFRVRATDSSVSVTTTGGKLYLESHRKLRADKTVPAVTVTVPTNHALASVRIDNDAGSTQIKGITADLLELEVGAGNTTISGVTVREKTEIRAGAGDLTVGESVLANANVKLGAGDGDLRCAFTDEAKLELGAGDLTIALSGSEADYTLDVDRGLGHVTVGGETLARDSVIGSGPVKVAIVHNLGDLTVTFGGAEPVSEA